MADHGTVKANGMKTKAELQREMDRTREALAGTVETIKDTVNEQYETVKETVTGVMDFRELFKEEPLIWSLGSLSAGFALGYAMGQAQKATKGKGSQIGAFANGLMDEFSTVGKTLVMPTLNVKIKELFGFDFSEVLKEIGSAGKSRPKRIGAGKASKSRKSTKSPKVTKRRKS